LGRFRGGWIKSWRGQFDRELSRNFYLWGIWSYLLHNANLYPSTILWEGKQRVINPGQLVIGLQEVADHWRCSKGVIHKWLHFLEKCERIVIEVCPRGTLVTICNWDVYQGTDEEAYPKCEQTVNTTWTQREHNVTLNEEYKNIRSNNIGSSDESPKYDLEFLYQQYPKRPGTEKGVGLENLKSLIKSEASYQKALKAIQNYSNHVKKQRIEPGFIKRFSTFTKTKVINSWANETEPAPQNVIKLEDPYAS
jgi:hypothetical protein